MSLDLTLLPFDSDSDSSAMSSTVLDLNLGGVAYEALEAMPNIEREYRPVPRYFTSYVSREGDGADSHYGNTQRDPFGEPVRTLPVTVLLRLRDNPDLIRSPHNRAVFAYLAELAKVDGEHRVALFWH